MFTLVPGAWLASWDGRGPLTEREEADLGDWLRKRPPGLWWILTAFPPFAGVRRHKAEGIVGGYIEPDEDHRQGLVCVGLPGSSRMVYLACLPDELEVISYWRGVDHAKIAALLDPGKVG